MTRINFEVSDEQNEAINDLQAQTGLKTRVQLFNTAFTLLEWAVKERENGNAIVAMNEQTGLYKELLMPGFPTPARQSPIRRKSNVGEYLNGLAQLVNTDEQARELAEVAQSFKEPLPTLLRSKLNLEKVVTVEVTPK